MTIDRDRTGSKSVHRDNPQLNELPTPFQYAPFWV